MKPTTPKSVMVTDAQDGVHCPSCGALDGTSWEWIQEALSMNWFECGRCNARHRIEDVRYSATIWLSAQRFNEFDEPVGAKDAPCCVSPVDKK